MDELGFIPVTLIPIIWIIAAYLLGSISFGILISKLYRLPDPRTVGSCNPGATNVLRSGKKSAAILTLLGDGFKGWFIVWLSLQSGMLMWVVAAVGLSVFFGHLYPIYHKFKGGKGVATALGVMLAISIWLGLAALITWALVFAVTRYSSLAAVLAAALYKSDFIDAFEAKFGAKPQMGERYSATSFIRSLNSYGWVRDKK